MTSYAGTAYGHTGAEIEAWEDDWNTRLHAVVDQAALSGLSLDQLRPLIEERIDFIERHSWHYNPPPARSSSSRSAPRGNTGMGSNVEQWRSLVAAYFPAHELERALCIMSYESGGNPNATNPSSRAAGLFQHLPKYWSDRSAKAGWAGAGIYDPTANVAVAAWLQGVGGWTHWSPYNRGLCR